MCETMLERNRDLETAHVQMMTVYRQNFLARVEAEGDVAQLEREAAEGDGDGINKLVTDLLPLVLEKLGGGSAGDALPPPKVKRH